MNKNSPLISIIMSVYNTEFFLSLAIKSILYQSFSDFEFIIINDGSTDNSGEILDKFSKMDPRIYVIHKNNTGISDSLNLAASLARGKFLARQDPDDISMLNRLKLQLNFLKKNPDIDVLGTCNFIINTKNEIINKYSRPLNSKDIKYYLSFYNPICHGSILMKKSSFFEVGMYDPSFNKAEDYELWFRFIKHNKKIVNLPYFLYLWRTHTSSVSGSQFEKQKYIVRKIFNKYNIDFNRFSSKFFKRNFLFDFPYIIKGYIDFFITKRKLKF